MRLTKNFIPVIFLISLFSACKSKAQQTDLSVGEFEKAIIQSNVQVLDVRTAAEYKSGYFKNSLLADWNDEAEFKKRVKAMDKSKPVYAYCLSGIRSGAAASWLRQNGFTAYNLSGGINAWNRAGKPVEHASQVAQISWSDYIALIPSHKTVLVDIGAIWCPPCLKMAPVMDSLVKIHGTGFELIKVDGGAQTAICDQLKVDGFPTFILYKGGKEVWRKQGIVEMREFVEKL